MFPTSFLGKHRFFSRSIGSKRARRRPGKYRPMLETLETRLAPAYISVMSVADNNDPLVTAGSGIDGTQNHPYQAPSLRSAIEQAGPDDQIIFDSTVFSSQNVSQTIQLFSTIHGYSGLTINGPVDNKGHNLVTITGDNLFPTGLEFFRGADIVPSVNVTINNLSFTECGGPLDGVWGAVAVAGTFQATFNNCSFVNNSGAIGFTQGGTDSSLTLNGCTISGSAGPYGAAVDGGIQTLGGPDLITATNCNFESNSGKGAIDNFGGPINLSGCTFTNNSGDLWGGAVNSHYGGVNLTACTFTNNSVTQNGGAVYALDNAAAFPSDFISLSGCTFTSNSAANGGAIYISAEGTPVSISNCTVNGNSAASYGGGVYVDPSAVSITSSTISNNTARTGADLYNLNSEVTLINSTVSNISNNGGTITTPDSAATNLSTQISALTQSGTLTANQAAGLTSKLQAAAQSLDIGNLTPGVNQLSAFINQVNAFVKSHKLTTAQAQPLIDGANQLITAASSGGARLVNDTGTNATSTADTQPVTDAGQLVTGPVGVYLANADGSAAPPDEQARFDDAIAALDSAFGPNGVDLVDVGAGDAADAVVQVEIAGTSAAGSAAEGVLGCTVAGNITLLTGWNWFTGADPTTIGSSQYDFETIVMHELGHAVGLGHSGDTGSVMYAYLAPGQTHRVVTTADLSVLDSPSTAPEPLLAAPWHGTAASYPVSALETGFVASDEKPGFKGRNRVEGDMAFAILGTEQLPLGSYQLTGRFGEPGRTMNALPVDVVFASVSERTIFAAAAQRDSQDAQFDVPLFPDPNGSDPGDKIVDFITADSIS
jgi:predicted outer membrane repeat protein